jgi:hypothetical protein
VPTVLRIGAYKFFFYANENNEPMHIHIRRDDSSAKFWLEPVKHAKSKGFTSRELLKLHRLVEEHREHLREAWCSVFDC